MLADLRYALRQLRRAPGFTCAAVLVLALGIGANATLFTLVNALFLRPLPVERPGELLRVSAVRRQGDNAFGVGGMAIRAGAFSAPDIDDLAGRRDLFAGVAAHGRAHPVLGAGGDVRVADARLVSAGYFAVLGVRPMLGRALVAGDGAVGAPPVAVVSHRYWREHSGDDSSIVGASIVLNGQPFTVVGVAPAAFHGTDIDDDPDVWAPLSSAAQLRPGRRDPLAREVRWLQLVARRAPGIDDARVRAALHVVAAQWEAAYPDTHRDLTMRVSPGATLIAPRTVDGGSMAGVFLTALWTLVGLVLAVACANVANLLLARAVQRRGEIAVRLALGAGRARLIRQFMTESALLALLGGAGGVAVATAIAPLAGQFSLQLDPSMDWRVFAFALVVATVTGVMFGLVPAMQATGGGIGGGLREAAVGVGNTRSRLRGALVVGQLAVTVALLVSAGLLLRTLGAVRTADVGYDPQGVLAVPFDVGQRGYDPARGRAFYDALLERVRTLPGVRSATLSAVVPLAGSGNGTGFTAPESPEPRRERHANFNVVAPDFFATLRIPIVQGRALGSVDGAGASPVVVVSAELARRAWPGEVPLGKRLRVAAWDTDLEVVGVAGDALFTGSNSFDEVPEPVLYVPFAQRYAGALALHVRADGDPRSLVTPVRRAARTLDAALVHGPVRTLGEIQHRATQPVRLIALLLVAFAAVGMTIASVGLGGVVAFLVSQRTREIGVRMALGAAHGDVLRLVLGEGLRLTAWGLVVGVVLALAVAHLLRSTLYGVGVADPVTFAGVGALFGAIALLATWLPARRATRVDPSIALRSE